MFRIFTRTWWTPNHSYPRGLELRAGRKHTLTKVSTEAEARSICKVWNSTHSPGKLSRKAEYEEIK